MSIITLFLPTWILALLALVIYFTELDLGSRIEMIAVVMLAYIAFTPVIRE